jgi:hypothetical protein
MQAFLLMTRLAHQERAGSFSRPRAAAYSASKIGLECFKSLISTQKGLPSVQRQKNFHPFVVIFILLAASSSTDGAVLSFSCAVISFKRSHLFPSVSNCVYVMTDASNMPVSQLASQSSDWPANHLNMYGKVTYGQMIGCQLADWHIRSIGRNIYNCLS